MLHTKKFATGENTSYQTHNHNKAQNSNTANKSELAHSSAPTANNTFWQQLAMQTGQTMPIQRKCDSKSNQNQSRVTATKQAPGNFIVGSSNDKYEQEADNVADKVMRTKDSELPRRSLTEKSQKISIQRKCQQCDENNVGEDPLVLQRKEYDGGSVAPNKVMNILNSSGQTLDASVKKFMEPRFGHDFGAIRVHTNAQAADSAKSINAKAYTSGNNIVFDTGQYKPRTDAGKKLLAHELTHTIQQDNINSPLQRALYSCEPEEDCEPREHGETSWSNSYGVKAEQISSPEHGFLVWGFPISSADTSALDPLPNWRTFWADMTTRNATWGVRGFSDCLGDDALNSSLRYGRALSVRASLPPSAQAKVISFNGAPLNQCMAGNEDKEERAFNRAAFFQILTENIDFGDTPVTGELPPIPNVPEACDASSARETALDCFPNPHGAHLPPVGGTHTESHPFEPCMLTEHAVIASPDWCVDNQQAHGGERCYREIPATARGPGDQYCFSENCCHNSRDVVSMVDPASPGAGACCQDNLTALPGHIWEDVVPEFRDDPERVIRDIIGM